MVYTRSMFTTLLAFGAASFVVVSAVPIDTNSGPSPTSTLTSDSHTPTSTSLSAAAASSTLLDLSEIAPLSQPAGDLLPERHQRRSIADNHNGGNGGGQEPAANGLRPPSLTEHDHPPPNHDRGNGPGQSQDAQPQPAANGRSPTSPIDETRVPAWAHGKLRTLKFTSDGFAVLDMPSGPYAAHGYPFLYGDGQTHSPGSNAPTFDSRANQ
ncbi:hypothetical protein FB446DRAFT_279920 [Lentinula raphanica]|nr:hypothetical protein FB446DRAFT_279920 [Lentinula raphanica]